MSLVPTTYLKDYRAPDFLIEKTDLVFELAAEVTRVTSTLLLVRNACAESSAPLVLDGQALVLESIAIDGRVLPKTEYQCDDQQLRISQVPDKCILTCVTKIKPHENTALEGLYQSNGMYCSQCEAEGFRKITYYLDRPDVMSVFSTKIIADKSQYPVLLSNGNLVHQGELEGGRHWAQWYDPFKKPAYLFALVAGNLSHLEDHFTTASGREVCLRIFVEEKDLDKCGYAMDALKRAMRWDEQTYGREYDLDIFMIVAVDDFNMGAMENKGLNIFNTSCVLAHPLTTTDVGFQRVEAVVAHEYFHNWSGNRVTCRDWFQLSLKEGFTVFRDAEFSADMGSAAVKRIEDACLMRSLQFAEDAGPMAHPVQPPSYMEISNFYTLTIYEKGAEVVRMLHTLLGAEQFRQGADIYFQRHDGQAVTIEDFVQAMEAASGRDLSQFMYWYRQAGTPIVTVTETYDPKAQHYHLCIKQSCPDTPEARGSDKQAYYFPLTLALLHEGKKLPLTLVGDAAKEATQEYTLTINRHEQTVTFTQVPEKPVLSILRGFCAPVRLEMSRSHEDYLQLLCYDDDAFSRWDAAQQLAVDQLQQLIGVFPTCQCLDDMPLVTGLRQALAQTSLDPAMMALLLTLPSSTYLAEIAKQVDIEAIHGAREALSDHIAQALLSPLLDVYQRYDHHRPYQATAQAIAERSLKNTALHYLMRVDTSIVALCYQQFQQANNMTDELAALKALLNSPLAAAKPYQDKALAAFYQKWQHESLVVNQWLAVQASIPHADTLSVVKQLLQHPCFSITNPNKVRALIGGFTQNLVAFHQVSGQGYEFLAEQVEILNNKNPQIAARLLTPLTRWQKYDINRQQKMRHCLQQLSQLKGLSKDVYEVVSKSL